MDINRTIDKHLIPLFFVLHAIICSVSKNHFTFENVEAIHNNDRVMEKKVPTKFYERINAIHNIHNIANDLFTISSFLADIPLYCNSSAYLLGYQILNIGYVLRRFSLSFCLCFNEV